MLTMSVSSFADDRLRTIPAPTVSGSIVAGVPVVSSIGAVIYPITKGAAAPFSGVLLNPAAVAQISVDKQTAVEACSIETKKQVDSQIAFDAVKIADKDSELKYTKDTLSKQLKDRDDQIKQLQKNSVSSTGTAWWLIGGFLGGVALTLGIVVVVDLSRK
jgi:hypothetical protein